LIFRGVREVETRDYERPRVSLRVHPPVRIKNSDVIGRIFMKSEI